MGCDVTHGLPSDMIYIYVKNVMAGASIPSVSSSEEIPILSPCPGILKQKESQRRWQREQVGEWCRNNSPKLEAVF